ncbi:MAG TPA: hypothetical protein VIG64_14750 [Actinomycetota bacterium]
MTTSIIASLMALAALGFLELFARIYPARELWWRLRRARGRESLRKMRERYESAGRHRAPRILAVIVIALVAAWVATASLLDKRWYEVVIDSLPSFIVAIALLRTPSVLRRVSARMKVYEREAGDEPDDPAQGGDPTALAL